ncbi:ARM repeat-containing protein [Lichtheimia hyalospora FSU 10163]|nr:ARM repeat-containing protein [Lichtheimia hyalospora FSU 10163]
MADTSLVDKLTQTIESLIISDNLQGNMSSVSEAFGHLVETIEQSKDNGVLWEQATRLAQVVAGTLVTESTRASFGEAGGISHVTRLLQLAENDTFKVQALRVLGNACIDYDDNRKRVHDAGVVDMVIPFLQEDQNPELTKVTCGFCLNSSVDYEPIQKAIGSSDGIEYLSKLLKPARLDHGELVTVLLAARALDNLMHEDSARLKFVSCNDAIERLLDLIKYEWQVDQFSNLDLLGSLVDTLLQGVAEDETAQNAVVDSGNFVMLLDFVEHAELPDEEENDEEEKKQFEEIMTTVTKCVVCAISSDSKMNELYKNDQLLGRFIGWARSKSEVLAQTGVYALGNLARSDEICIDLVKRHHLHQALLEAFNLTDKATFRYAILGCLKHLCLAKENRSIIGEANIISTITPLLETTNDMLKRNQFLTIGIIKLLCANEYTNSKEVISGSVTGDETKTPLELVLACLERFDDVAAKSEATRILTNLIKSVWLHQGNEASASLRKKLLDQRVVQPIVEMTRASNFPILKNDGVIALSSMLAAWKMEDAQDIINVLSFITADAPPLPDVQPSDEEQEQEQQAKPETRSFLEVITDMVTTNGGSNSRPIPPEMQWNVCVLLEKIVEAAKGVEYQATIDKIKMNSFTTLEQAAQRTDMVGPAAQKVVATLN